MQNIIYRSENIIPWDTQSAFKMTDYNSSSEENMVFCYLKGYVHGGDLVLCTYCFTENPHGKESLRLYINPNPEKYSGAAEILLGYDGIAKAEFNGCDFRHRLEYHPFKADDEQGFYWCGELRFSRRLLGEIWGTELAEKSLVTMNMVQKFPNGDFSVLFGDACEENYTPADNMEVFAILNY